MLIVFDVNPLNFQSINLNKNKMLSNITATIITSPKEDNLVFMDLIFYITSFIFKKFLLISDKYF